MEKGLVVKTDCNGVLEIRSVTKENAESQFLDCCINSCSNWEEHSSQDVETIAEEGVFTTIGGTVIAIIWLDVDGQYNT